jgi:hypothetical protein
MRTGFFVPIASESSSPTQPNQKSPRRNRE